MAYSFNPFTGKLDDVGAGGGGGATLGANTFTATKSITAAANTSALTASYSVTGAATTPLLDLSGTWNTTGVARGILLNVTDTASSTTSRLLDLQRNSSSVFSVNKVGQITAASFSTTSTIGIFQSEPSTIRVSALATFAWQSGSNWNGTSDVILARDSAGTLAQRNGTNAQTFRLYNTFTDASNYERGFMRWNANILEIGTEAGGTGTARNLTLTSSATTAISCAAGGGVNLQFNGSNRFQIFNTSTICSTILRISSTGGFRLETASTPASATATGTTGDIRWDADYVYVCTATNTWKRSPLSTW